MYICEEQESVSRVPSHDWINRFVVNQHDPFFSGGVEKLFRNGNIAKA
jgi:hypothetical protein